MHFSISVNCSCLQILVCIFVTAHPQNVAIKVPGAIPGFVLYLWDEAQIHVPIPLLSLWCVQWAVHAFSNIVYILIEMRCQRSWCLHCEHSNWNVRPSPVPLPPHPSNVGKGDHLFLIRSEVSAPSVCFVFLHPFSANVTCYVWMTIPEKDYLNVRHSYDIFWFDSCQSLRNSLLNIFFQRSIEGIHRLWQC